MGKGGRMTKKGRTSLFERKKFGQAYPFLLSLSHVEHVCKKKSKKCDEQQPTSAAPRKEFFASVSRIIFCRVVNCCANEELGSKVSIFWETGRQPKSTHHYTVHTLSQLSADRATPQKRRRTNRQWTERESNNRPFSSSFSWDFSAMRPRLQNGGSETKPVLEHTNICTKEIAN